jgi:hypothetical protein
MLQDVMTEQLRAAFYDVQIPEHVRDEVAVSLMADDEQTNQVNH